MERFQTTVFRTDECTDVDANVYDPMNCGGDCRSEFLCDALKLSEIDVPWVEVLHLSGKRYIHDICNRDLMHDGIFSYMNLFHLYKKIYEFFISIIETYIYIKDLYVTL